MNFDVYYPFKSKDGKIKPGVKPVKMDWARIKREVLGSPQVKDLVVRHRRGEEGCKIQLPAIGFVGNCQKTRAARYMIPTQLVMIDIDHVTDARLAWQGINNAIKEKLGEEWFQRNVQVVHVTPSGGLHIFFTAQPDCPTLKDNMDYLNSYVDFGQYGDYDEVVHDFARISFAFPVEDLLIENVQLIMNTTDWGDTLRNEAYEDPSQENQDGAQPAAPTAGVKVPSHQPATAKSTTGSLASQVPEITPEMAEKFDKEEYKGVPLKTIIDRFVEVNGAPGKNEVHNYYNMMVKYFRNIMSNNKVLLLHLLPRFGHTAEECWSQIVSICRVNTLSALDKPFYWFLRENGFLQPKEGYNEKELKEYMMAERPEEKLELPKLPPVFREFVNAAPTDFKLSTVNALMPILGTLTSWVEAVYPYDDAPHTTSFFAIVYAPPGTGKSFVNRLMKLLFVQLYARDFVQQARENVYLRILNRKGSNEKSPERPVTSLRIIPPKNSEAEFLQKQQDNKGYHMFTFAAEMDSWAKGEKAAGGNKSDMIRIAWDNGRYGQQFKSSSTFKGEVNLYWNVLITGTLQQVESYFKNVENGLVTRCSFTSLYDQEFKPAPIWKPISQKGLEVIRRFVQKCDDMTYESPCTVTREECETVSDDDFDKEIDWRFKFREKQVVDMAWIMPTINKFHDEQIKLASLDVDRARDVFRRRVGVRGFRLALICWCLYNNPRKKEQEVIKEFVWWWMHQDLKCMLELWGKKYNEQTESAGNKIYNRKIYSELGETFTKSDIYVLLKREHILTPVTNVVSNWKQQGFVEKIAKDTWKKKKV